MNTKLSIIIPAYNEERTINIILAKITEVDLNGVSKEIIVVDDCSNDNTIAKVNEFISGHPSEQILLIQQEINQGKGAAIHKGIEAATGDFLLIQDADLEYDPREYSHLLRPMLEGHADVVYGSRFMGHNPHRILFFWHSIGNKFLTSLSNMFTNLNLTDMETCYKLFKTSIIKNIDLEEKRFGFEAEITAKISRIPQIKIYEVGISYYGRTYEEGKKINWKDGLRAIYCILKYNFFARNDETFKIGNKSKKPEFLLLGVLLGFFLVILSMSDGFAGGADNMTHYRYARYAFQHPEFFLWHWGKPIFTLLSSPFAQVGFIGVQIFNILCGLLSAYLASLIVRDLGFSRSWIVLLLTCFVPIYTVLMISGMTEILFSFIAILSVFLFLREKYILSAIVISFLPLARTEGIFIIMVFGLAYLVVKQYKAIPFLLVAFLLYSIVGSFYYDDFFWLINEMPYNGYKVYGTGKLMHFVNRSPKYFGWVLSVLALIGIVMTTINFFKRREIYKKLFLLVLLPFLVYFSAHSIMWYTGYGNSAGLHRYMAGIAPFFAILAFIGLHHFLVFLSMFPNWLSSVSGKQRNKIGFFVKTGSTGTLTGSLRLLFLGALLYFVVIAPFKSYTIPIPYDHAQVVIKSFADWYKVSEYDGRKIYYYHPDVAYFLELNPYDKTKSRVLIYNNEVPHERIEPGSLIIWDSYFSETNGLKLETIQQDEYLKKLNEFGSENIVVFERQNNPKNRNQAVNTPQVN